MPHSPNRRSFLKSSSALFAGGLCTNLLAQPARRPRYGQGDFQYEQEPGWGVLDPQKTPVNNCHGIAYTRDGFIVLLTDHTKNNVIIYDRAGKLVSKWGVQFPKAHGLVLREEAGREALYITDLDRNSVFKTTLDGELLDEWGPPIDRPQYSERTRYRPSWTLHFEDGGFLVLDGYGKDYFIHYDDKGRLERINGGPEGGIVHWGPHGGLPIPSSSDEMLIAMSDQQYLLHMNRNGDILRTVPLPGGNPRSITYHQNHYFIAHLADNWPADRNSRGFLSVLNNDLEVVSNIAGNPPEYDNKGALREMAHREPLFIHPHDLVVDSQDSLYCAQFASNQTYPIKLARV